MNLVEVAWDTKRRVQSLQSGPTLLRSATIVRTFSFAWAVNLLFFLERKRLFVRQLRYFTLNLTNILINFTAKNVYWTFSLRFVRMTFGSWRVRATVSVHEIYEFLSALNYRWPRRRSVYWTVPCVLIPPFAYCDLSTVMSADCFLSDRAPFSIPLQIPETEGASLAASHSVGFCEVSVAENSPNLYKIFEKLLIESRARPVKPRKFSVSKMIGNLCTLEPSEPDSNVAFFFSQLGTLIGNNGARQLPSINQGTVQVCHKGELQKNRLIKRRQAFTAAASLWPATLFNDFTDNSN